MWPYWVLFAAPSVAALMKFRLAPDVQRVLWVAAAALLLFMIGFRREVGGDWFPYQELYDRALSAPLDEIIDLADPGYALLTWVAAYLDLSIYAVNLVCAAVFVTGMVAFCRRQPNPALGLAVSVPLMVILLAMGYTRQATAVGFELMAIVALQEGKARRFLFLALAAALFHRSALVLLPLVIVLKRTKWRHKTMWTMVVLGVAVAGFTMMSDYYSVLWGNYVAEQKDSQGAMARLLVNAIPGLILLFFRRQLFRDEDRRLWIWIALASIACVPLAAVASTATDRLALYLSPLQIVVMTRLPRLFHSSVMRSTIVAAILIAYAAILFTWLNFAVNAEAWVPYQTAVFE